MGAKSWAASTSTKMGRWSDMEELAWSRIIPAVGKSSWKGAAAAEEVGAVAAAAARMKSMRRPWLVRAAPLAALKHVYACKTSPYTTPFFSRVLGGETVYFNTPKGSLWINQLCWQPLRSFHQLAHTHQSATYSRRRAMKEPAGRGRSGTVRACGERESGARTPCAVGFR